MVQIKPYYLAYIAFTYYLTRIIIKRNAVAVIKAITFQENGRTCAG